MKLKFSTLGIAALLTGALAFAQDDVRKFGPNPDKTNEELSLYNEAYKQKNYDDAYSHWSYVFHNAPERTKNLYIHGPKMIESFIKKTEDLGEKHAWLDSLYMVYDQKAEVYPKKKGESIGKKGTAMYKHLGKAITDEELQDANKIFKEAYNIDGNNIAGTVINYYFLSSAKLLNKKLYTVDQLITMYANLSEVISYQTAKYSDDRFAYKEKIEAGNELSKKEAKRLKITEQKLSQLEKVSGNIETTLAPYASCEKLEEIYTKAFEENKDDVAWLERAANLMKKKKCTESDLFFQIAEQQYTLNPSASAAINLAYKSIKGKDYVTANKYIDEAVGLETDNIKKADYLYLKAQVQLGRGQYQSAYATAREVIGLRKGWGAPYLIMGKAYAATSRKCGELQTEFKKRLGYCAALDKFEYAKRLDSSVASEANRLIATYGKQVPSITDAFTAGKSAGQKVTINCWYTETVTLRTTKSN